MTDERSVTRWLQALEAGEDDAARELWERYFPVLVKLVRTRLGDAPRTMADEEDVALSVFDSLCRGVSAGRFDLRDRNALWRLLMVMVRQKSVDYLRHELAIKRGGNGVKVAGESAASDGTPGSPPADWIRQELEALPADDPAPDFAVMISEECRRLMAALRDDTLRQIASWRVEGYTSHQIADKLEVSERTVERKLKLIRERWTTVIDH